MMNDDPAVQWLLASPDPSVRYLTLTEVLDAPPHSREAVIARAEIPGGARVRALLAEQGAGKRKTRDSLAVHPGGFGVHPYKKWDGAHWRLVSLVELGVGTSPVDERPEGLQVIPEATRASKTKRSGEKRRSETLRVLVAARAAADQVLQWLTSDKHRAQIKSIDGRTRRCASQEGNALAVCSRLGMVADPRVQALAESLIKWQWDDGGWNCDKRPEADHSSFYESLAPLWGLIEYHRVTQDKGAWQAVERGAELFISHRLFRSDITGRVINPEWCKLHYPLYWHYDILQALVILARAGKVNDLRASEALDMVASKRRPDGLWRAEGYYWQPLGANARTLSGAHSTNIEVVDWGRRGPNEMITLNAVRALKAAARL